MADATISNTLDGRLRAGNNRIEGLKAAGLKVEVGTLTFDGGNYATGGIAWTPDGIDADRLLGVFFETSVAGWQFHYITATGLLTLWNGTTQYTNASAISITTKYLAIGY
jgi:hypothetical protein